MRDEGDGYMIINANEEEDVEFYPIDSIELSEDTEWFFEGALLSMLQLVDDTFPSVDISTRLWWLCVVVEGDDVLNISLGVV